MDELKPVRWLGTSRSDIRAFPDRVKQLLGTELMALQLGYDPGDWKPLTGIGQESGKSGYSMKANTG